MKYFTQSLFFAGLLMCAQVVTAQNTGVLNCGHSQYSKKHMEEHPELQKEAEQAHEEITKYSKKLYAERGQKEEKIYRIPVVFHIVHNFGMENISVAQVNSAIDVLNEEFGKTNAAAANIVPAFANIAADCNIEFRLATIDPLGNCTNGIMRYVDTRTNSANDAVKAGRQWPRQKYLNIYVVNKIGDAGVAGYAYYPGTATADVDGVIINHDYVGRTGTGVQGKSSALTHEVGHYLALSHTWGNTNDPGVGCGGTDFVDDTPECKGSSVCNLNANTCNAGMPGDKIDNIQNFMEYAYCYAMFTEGQKARMRGTLQLPTSSRNNLWTDLNLAATGANYDVFPTTACKADFIPETNKPICEGTTMTFTDYSYYNITSWKWTFEGGTPETSTEKNPTVTYNTPGVFKVTLEVTDGNNNILSTTKENQVIVLANNILGTSYTQDFETLSLLTDPDFKTSNPNNDKTWVIKDGVGYNSNRSIYIQNRLVATKGYADELISSTFDLSGTVNPVLTFKYAHAAINSATAPTNNDQLQLWTSKNCGETWQQKKVFMGSTLRTAPDVPTGDFIPNNSQWKEGSYPLSSLKEEGLRIKFVWINGDGNNIYLDDINITDLTGVSENFISNSLNIFPNPMDESAEIIFNIQKGAETTIELYDLLGRSVERIFSGKLQAGEHRYTINKGALNAGVYFVKLTVNENSFSRKIAIN